MWTLNDDPANTTAGAADPAAAAASTQGAASGAAGADGGSLFDGVTPTAGDAPKPLGERIPEKYRVIGADGKLDEAASMAKVLDGYDHLSKKLGSGGDAPPATPADYKLELLDAEGKAREDVDLAQFTADPMFQEFAKAMHAEGVTNKQMNAIVQRYLDFAPNLVAADAQMSLAEAKAELGKLWPDEASFNGGIQSAMRAMKGFGAQAEDMPGSHARLMSKYARDPDFMAFAASIGREMSEDKPVADGLGTVGEGDIESLQKSQAYWDANHPDHAKTKTKVADYYAKKFGTGPKVG